MSQDRVTAIRPAAASDVPLLLTLISQYWSFEGIAGFEDTRVAQQIGRLLSTPSLGAGWIAEVDGSAVGYLLAVYVFSLEHLGLTAEIDEFFVSPQCRGQGVGTETITLLRAECRRRALRPVAGCWYYNHASRRTLERAGMYSPTRLLRISF